MIAAAPRRKIAPAPHRAEQIVAAALEAENREVADLGGIQANRHRGNRPLARFSLPVPSWPAGSGRTPKTRPGDITDLVVRRFHGGASSLEELLIALYCGNVSISRAEKIVKSLWNGKTDVALVSRHVGEIKQRILDWLRRPIADSYPYVFLQVMPLKAGERATREWHRAFVAVGVSTEGIREVLAVRLSAASDISAWGQFLGDLRYRGLGETRLFLGGNEPPLIAAAKEHFPGVPYQGDFAQMEREVLKLIPVTQLLKAGNALTGIRDCESPETAREKLLSLQDMLQRSQNAEAARILALVLPFLCNFSRFPRAHWPRLQTSWPFIKVMRDCREWIRVGGDDTSPEDLLLMVAARWRQASRVWARRKFLSFGA